MLVILLVLCCFVQYLRWLIELVQNSRTLSEVMLLLIEDPRRIETWHYATCRFGFHVILSKVGKTYAALFQQVINEHSATER